ncbi:MAG: response regulator [Phycisphaerales bacterium]|nr:response regulator [Phycisphaerales bacterium]
MLREHAHPDRSTPAGVPGGRLNLLLSRAGWQPDPWVDRLPRMLEPMGIQSHIAHNADTAQRVIDSNAIHIAVVDLALPLDSTLGSPAEESGPRLLNLLSRLASPPPIVVIKRNRTARDDMRELNAALRAGAFAVVDRPNAQRDLESLLEVLRRCLTRHYEGRWPNTSSGAHN